MLLFHKYIECILAESHKKKFFEYNSLKSRQKISKRVVYFSEVRNLRK